jgi:4-O-beta-D-mannosyl-D-glucose phosphorylase
MDRTDFDARLKSLMVQQEELVSRQNAKVQNGNGIFEHYLNPVLTPAHTPVFWRYDLRYETNPFLLERLGINATFNSGAMEFDDKIVLAVRIDCGLSVAHERG